MEGRALTQWVSDWIGAEFTPRYPRRHLDELHEGCLTQRPRHRLGRKALRSFFPGYSFNVKGWRCGRDAGSQTRKKRGDVDRQIVERR
jgi:hypothetical protein